jgi:threonine/homoserine/homoserine lactone efflux protein
MELSFFIKGLIFGFSIAAPVGPIGILCIRRSLADGWSAGLLTGLGAATADACYGCVAGFGLAGISGFLVGQQVWIQLFGGLFLCWLGLRVFLADADRGGAAKSSGGAAKGYLSALFLTLTNPMTILSFAAVFAGMGLGRTASGPIAAGGLVAGVFTGSMAWWIVLSSATSLLNSRMNASAMRWINRLSGAVLVGFGLIVVIGRA